MKKILISALLLLGAMELSAQRADSVNARRGSVTMDWMQPFEGASVEGPVKVCFKQVGEQEPMKISYDTKANPDSRVKVSVDKYGILNIREKGARGMSDSIEITVCYRTMKSLRIDGANARFENVLRATSIDLVFSGGAAVDLPLLTTDVVMRTTGKCNVTLSGRSRYYDLTVSTATVDASALQTLSTRVNASHGAEVRVTASERLEAKSSSARVIYVGEPQILRSETSSLGGVVESESDAKAREEKESKKLK